MQNQRGKSIPIDKTKTPNVRGARLQLERFENGSVEIEDTGSCSHTTISRHLSRARRENYAVSSIVLELRPPPIEGSFCCQMEKQQIYTRHNNRDESAVPLDRSIFACQPQYPHYEFSRHDRNPSHREFHFLTIVSVTRKYTWIFIKQGNGEVSCTPTTSWMHDSSRRGFSPRREKTVSCHWFFTYLGYPSVPSSSTILVLSTCKIHATDLTQNRELLAFSALFSSCLSHAKRVRHLGATAKSPQTRQMFHMKSH